jgi:hypothetical protein
VQHVQRNRALKIGADIRCRTLVQFAFGFFERFLAARMRP